MLPETRYARGKESHVAYQVMGDGPLDLVFVPSWASNIEVMWEEPSLARFAARLAASLCRRASRRASRRLRGPPITVVPPSATRPPPPEMRRWPTGCPYRAFLPARPSSMWLALKRLALGIVLIVLASAVLLGSDWGRRTGATLVARRWKLDLLQFVKVLDVEEAERGVRAGLREAGLVEGRDYELRVRNAQGDMPTLSTMVDAALSSGADLLLTLSTPTLQAALRRAGEVPVVFTFVADAVAAGAGRSNEDHLPNVTGVPSTAAYDEMIDIVRQCMPAVRRIGMLFAPAEVNSVYNKEQLGKAAARHGLELVTVAVSSTTEVPDATLALLAQRIDALCQGGSNLTAAAFASIARSAQRARVPVFGFLSSDLGNGAAVVLARDYFDGGREAALMAVRIMRGERPAAIPFRPLETTHVLVNLEAARAVGLTIPPALLGRASKVIGG